MAHTPTEDLRVLRDALLLLLHPKNELNWRQAAEDLMQEDFTTRSSPEELDAGLGRLTYISAGLCKRRNAHRPVHRLPTEILETVLLLSIKTEYKPVTRALTLSQVCEHWSRTIHARSSFWSTISADDHPDLAIELARERPLTFSMSYMSRSLRDNRNSWELFEKIASRLRTARLLAAQPNHEDVHLQKVASHLEVLGLDYVFSNSASRTRLGFMPSLEMLKIRRDDVDLEGFRAPQLRFFCIQKLRLSESACVAMLQTILRDSPLLEWVVIEAQPESHDSDAEVTHGEPGEAPNYSTITLSHLRQLYLPNFKHVGVICGFIHAPFLKTLDVNLTLASNLTPEGDLTKEIFTKERIPLAVAAARNTRSPLYARAESLYKVVLSNNRPLESRWAVHMSLEFSSSDMRLTALQHLIDVTQFYDVPLIINFSRKTHLVERLHGIAAVRVSSAKRFTSLVDLMLSLDGVELYHSLISVQLGWPGVEEEQLRCDIQRLYAYSPPKRLAPLEPSEVPPAERMPISERLSLWDDSGKRFNLDTSKFEEVAPAQRGNYILIYAEGSGDGDYPEDSADEDEDNEDREDDEDEGGTDEDDEENEENKDGGGVGSDEGEDNEHDEEIEE